MRQTFLRSGTVTSQEASLAWLVDVVTRASTPASLSRYSRASGPNRMDSGTAIPPSLYVAMGAIAVSAHWGRRTATRDPRDTPAERRRFARRFDRNRNSP